MVVFLCKFNIQNDLALKNKLLISLTLHFATKIKARELIIQMQYFQSMTFTEYHPLPGSDNHGQCGDLLGTQQLTIQNSLVLFSSKLGYNQLANSAWLPISADPIKENLFLFLIQCNFLYEKIYLTDSNISDFFMNVLHL